MRKIYSLLLLLVFYFAASTVSAQISVTASGGTTSGSYTTLKGAFDAINLGTHTGTITISVTANTTETAPAVLNASGSGAASYAAITISPSGGAARTISGAITAGSPLLDLNGADNVTIDGLNTGGNALTISNTTASATAGTSTIRFIADATSNLVTNCTILGSSTMTTTTLGGTVFFSTATTTGNDNNTISSCNIGPAGSNLPSKAVFSLGTTTAASNYTNNVTITGCNIYDFFNAAAQSNGLYVGAGNTDWTISNNKFYQTAARTQTTGAIHAPIQIASSTGNNNVTVSGNTIGYSSSSATGTYTFTGVSSSSRFVPIYFSSAGTTTANNIQGNTITNIVMSGAISGTLSSGPFIGIYLTGLSNASGNIIGSQSTAGVISLTSSSASSGNFYGIYNNSSSNTDISSNQIGGITINNSSTGTATFTGLYINTSSSATATINSNLIGGTNTNSITLTSASTGSLIVGINNGLPASTISGNTIRNLTNNNGTGTGSTSSISAIVSSSTATTNSISGNTITTLTSSGASAVVAGITITGATTVNISGNTISGLTGSGTTSPVVNGIQVSSGTTVNIFKNKVYDLSETGAIATTSPAVNGMVFSGGTTVNAYNNLIGDLRAPSANLADAIRGISITSATAGTTYNVYYNTIYINATSTGTNFGTSGVFHTTGASGTGNLDLRNNIVANTSTAKGTGLTVAYRRSSTTLTNYASTSNNNDFYAGTPGAANLIYYDATNSLQTIAAYKALTGLSPRDQASFSTSPNFLSTTGASANFLHIDPAIATQLESGGSPISGFTDDFDGNTRNSTLPDVGADEFAGSTPAPGVSAVTLVTAGNQCTATAHTVTATIVNGTSPNNVVSYSFNGGAPQTVVMTNTSGNTWTASIPAATPNNATVAWSVIGSDGTLSTTVAGTSYSDEPLFGVTTTLTPTPATVCSGSQTTLAVGLSRNNTPKALGAGASTSSSTAATFFPGSWGGAKTQYIIRASELQALGYIGTTTFTSLGFEPTTSGQTYTGFAVSMGNTTQSSMTTTFIASGLTQVYAGTEGANNGFTPVANTLNTLTFGTGSTASSFVWDGSSNVVVSICWSSVPSASTSTSSTMKVDAPGFTCSAYDQTDAVTPAAECATTTADGTGTNRPKFTLTGNSVPAVSSVSWSNTTTGTSIAGATSTVNYTPPANNTSSPVTYNIQAVVSASGCTANATSTITVNPLPVAPNTVDGSQCGAGVPTSGTVSSAQGTTTPRFVWYLTSAPTTPVQDSSLAYYGTSISSAADFLVAEKLNGCIGPKSPLHVAVGTPSPYSVTSNKTLPNICNGDIVQLSANGVYDEFTWIAPAGVLFTDATAATVYTTGTKVQTVYFKSTTAGAYNIKSHGYNSQTACGNDDSAQIFVQPSGVTISASSGTICKSGTTTLTASPSTGYAANSLQWQVSTDGGTTYNNITGQTGSTYTTGTLTASVMYKLVVNNSGNFACQQPTVAILVGDPQLTGTTSGQRCGPGTVTLGASSGGRNKIRWYSAATGGTPLATGTSYTTPSISATTTYYAAAYDTAVAAIESFGASYSGTSTNGTSTGSHGILFTTSLPGVVIKSAKIPFTGTGTFSIQLRNSSGTAITTYTTGTVTGSGSTAVTVPLDITVATAGSYQLIVNGITGSIGALGYRSSGLTFPYTSPSGAISVTAGYWFGSDASSNMYLFDLTALVTGACEQSPRTAVVATINTPPAITASATKLAICNGGSADLTVSSTNSNYTYTWTPATGLNTTTGTTVTAAPTASTAYTVNAIDNTTGNSTSGCAATAVVSIAVQPNAAIVASPEYICGSSGTSTLSASPSTGYAANTLQWQSSTNGSTYTDIPSQTSATYTTPTLSATAYYRLIVKDAAGLVCSQPTQIITVSNPTVSATTGAARCGTGTVSLTATVSNGATVKWYDAATGGNLVGTGSPFTTPAVSATTTYYAAASNGLANSSGGRTAPTVLTAGTTASSYGLVFDAYKPFTLEYVTVYSRGSGGNMIIGLYDNTGALIQSTGAIPVGVGTTASPVAYRVPVGLSVPQGTGWRMLVVSSPDLVRESSIGGFPYSLGANGSITDGYISGTSTTYYFLYNWEMTSECESARMAATATVTAAAPISVSANRTVSCSGAAVNLSATSSNTDYQYTWTPGTNLTGPNVTVNPTATTTYTVNAVDNVNPGACTAVGTITISVQPTPTITATPSTICVSGSTTLSANPSTGYAANSLQWQSSTNGTTYTNITGATGATYTTGTLTSTGYYKLLVLNGSGSACTPSPTITISVNNPQVTSVTPASRCGTGTVTLGANTGAGATIQWYAAATGGTPLATGNTFTTPSISSTTTYYAASVAGQGSARIGMANPALGTFSSSFTGSYEIFDVTQTATISTVDFYPTSAGTVVIELRNSSSTVLQTATYTVTAAQANSTSTSMGTPVAIPVNFTIPPGTGYQLNLGSATTASTIRNSAGAAATYGPVGGITITGNSNSTVGYYYNFYNWLIVTGCESARTAVVATVNTPPAINATGTATICQGQSTPLNVTSSNSGYTYTWTPGNLTGASQSVSPSSTTTYTVNAVDNSGGSNNTCATSATVTVTVNPRPTQVFVTPNTTAICNGTTTAKLVASGGTIGANGAIQGTAPTTSAGTFAPFYRNYEGARKQYMYSAAELTALGLSSGVSIKSIAFNVTALAGSGNDNLDNFSIKAGLTSTSDLASAFITGLTTVYTPAGGSYTVTAGVNSFTFNTPITWDGTSNLVIEICHDNDPDNTCNASSPVCWGNNSTVSMSTAGFTASREIHQDNSTGVRSICDQTAGVAAAASSTLRPDLTLTAAVSTTIAWTPTAGLFTDSTGTTAYTGQDIRTVYASPASTTTYTATATSAAGCTTTTPGLATVNVGAALSVTANTSNANSCGGTSVTISATVTGGGAPYTYSWSDGNSVVSTAASFTATPTVSTTYTVTVGDNCGNSLTKNVSVTVTTAPTASISPAGTVNLCSPQTQVLTASTDATSATYQWRRDGANISGATSSTYTASLAGVYTVVVTNTTTTCSTTSSGVTVTVNPVPSAVSVSPNTTSVCGSNAVALTATGGQVPGSGSLTGTSPTTASSTVTPFYRNYEGARKQFMYSAAELSALGMVSGSTISSISFNVTALASTSNNNLDNFSLKAGLTTTADLSSAFITGLPVVYTPAGGNYTVVSGTNSFTFSTPITWDGTSNLVLEICHDNDPNNTCSAGSPVCWGNIPTMSMATAGFTATREIHEDNSTGVRSICSQTTGVSAAGTSTVRPVTGISFTQPTNVSWTPTTGLYTNAAATTPYTGGNTRTVYALPAATTTYTATATGTGGCGSAAGTATVNVGAPLVASASAAQSAICNGSSTTLTASATGGGAPYTYSWSVGGSQVSTSQSFSVSPIATTTYSVTVTGQCGAQDTKTVTVTVNALPTVSVSPTGTINICAPATQLLTATTNASSPTYSWKLNNGLAGGTGSTFTVNQTGNYSVVVTDGSTNCQATSSVVVVNVNPKPATVSVTPASPTICAGSVQMLTATGGGVTSTGTTTGSAPTTANSAETPFYRGTEGARRQYLVTAAELTAMGVASGNPISSIAFNVTAIGATPNTFTNFNVRAGLSSSTLLSGFISTGLNTVYTASTYTPIVGSNKFNFSTPVTWDGSSNLVIEMCFDNDAAGTCSTCTGNSSTVSIASTSGGVSRYVASDNASGSRTMCSISTGSVLTNVRPIITLGFIPAGQFTWTPSANLYTDSTATTAYVPGSKTSRVFAKVTSNSTFTATSTSAQGCSNSGFATIYMATPVVPSVSIAANNNPACTGGTVKFTATPTNGGNTPTYVWKKNGTTITGATGSTYSANNLVTGDQIQVVMTSSLGCTTTSTATSNTVTMTVGPNTWTGTVNNLWSLPDNWCAGVVPTATSDAIIPSGVTKYPILSQDVSVRNLTIQNGASVSLGVQNLDLKGTLTVAGTGGFIGTSASKLTISGAGTTTNLAFASGGNNLAALTVSGTGGTVVNVSGVLNIYDVLTVTAGTLNTGGALALKSSANGTARVAPVSGTINGAVSVERYISGNGRPAWRLLSVPTQTTETFHQAWQENQSPMVVGTPGLGTLITNPAGAAKGFDTITAGASLLRFNQAAGQQGSFGWVSRTDSNMATTSGYFLYIRGDRTIRPTGSLYPPTSTVLRTRGPLYTGTQPSITLPANTNVLVGNVYASAIDFATLTRSNVNAFKVWDPKLSGSAGLGAYQTFSATTGYDPVPGGGSYGSTPNSRIESGQAFIVSSSTGGSIQLTEAAKTTGSRNVFRTNNNVSQFKVNLYAETANGAELADGNSVVTDEAYSTGLDEGDVVKAANIGENFGLYSNNTQWVIEGRKPFTADDTLHYQMKNLRVQDYTLEFLPRNMNGNVTGYLEDAFTGAKTEINMTGSTLVRFTVTTDAASKAADRFRVVFKSTANSIPVTMSNLKAQQKVQDVQVDWTVTAEKNVRQYEVEHSTDGSNFTKAGTVKAQNSGAAQLSYSFMHEKPNYGEHYYRVRAINMAGETKYTNTAKVTITKGQGQFVVYPNPIVNNKVNVKFVNQAEGKYTIRLVDKSGNEIYRAVVQHTTATGTHSIELSSAIAAGTYQLEVAGVESRSVQTVIVSNK